MNDIISNFLDAQAKLANQEQEMLNAAAEYYGKKDNIVINQTVIKVDNKKNMKGLVVGIRWHSHEEDDYLMMGFSWRIAIIRQDGTHSNVVRWVNCENEIFHV